MEQADLLKVIIDSEITSVSDVWNAIDGKSLSGKGSGEKKGSRTVLELREYDLGNGRFLQVAFDPDLGFSPIEWEETEGQFPEWIVG